MATDLLHHDFGSESEDEEFQPQAHIEDDDARGDAGDNRSSRKSSASESRKRKARSDDEDEGDDEADRQLHRENGDVDEEEGDAEEGDEDDARSRRDNDEDEDEDEEEEDEEEGISARPRKRHKRDARLNFLDVEAEVDDEDEEEAEDEDELPDETHPDDLLDMPAGTESDDRRHRELDRQREIAASLDAEKQAAVLREKYGRNRSRPTDAAVMPQHLLVPSVEDPGIWCVKAKPGKEREVVMAIMQRYENRLNTKEPLGITSAFERGASTPGYIYIEARKQVDVLAATDGISFCYSRNNKIILIPINQMPDLLRTTKSKTLEPGMYVRIKRGTYAGDLALVESAESNGTDVSLQIIPRLDYGQSKNAVADGKRKRPGIAGTPGTRPPARLFNSTEAKKDGKAFQQVSNFKNEQFTYYGETYINGFLYKDFKISALQLDNVNPTLEEVTKFAAGAEDGTENLDLAALAATLKASVDSSDFHAGDIVEIFQGEQTGVWGKTITVRNEIVTLEVLKGDMRGQKVDAPVKSLRKKFREGDHVRVIGGSKYRDESGMVVRVKDDLVTLTTDNSNEQITVFSKDLRGAEDSGAAVGVSKYDLYDLVQLDASTVGCIVKVDREALRVLDQNASVRNLLPSNISNKLERRRNAVATDRDGSEVRPDDTVKETAGEQRQGRVIHIHRNFLFAQSRQQTANAGIFVVRSGNVTTVAARGGRVNNAGPDLTKMNPALQRQAANGNAVMGPPKTIGRDKLIGKTVTVGKGPHKGLLGIVKDTTDAEARVELHSKNKIITLKKEILRIKDPVTGQSISLDKFGRGRPGALPSNRFGAQAPPSSRVPDFGGGSRTPAAAMGPASTPGWKSARTPGWAMGGGKTPMYSAEGGRTVYGGADGSRTSYGGGDGSRTSYGGSTWNSNSRTPYAANSGYSGGDGGRTPYGGSRTPAHAGYAYNAPTPGAANAPTPGGPSYYSSHQAGQTPMDAPTPGFAAPTPGATTGETPRGYGGGYGDMGQYGAPTPAAAAPTPGAFPATPGAWAADTPGGYAGDDPHYE